jgi:hypothetical protein
VTDLTELLERVKTATGSDRMLDLAIAQALNQPWQYTGEPPQEIFCARFTSSLDAALALVERVFPAAHWATGTVPDAGWQDAKPGEFYASTGAKWTERHYGTGKTPALALLAALLSALAAQGDVGEHQPK